MSSPKELLKVFSALVTTCIYLAMPKYPANQIIGWLAELLPSFNLSTVDYINLQKYDKIVLRFNYIASNP
jgi:hypothetical protein